ncbi:hypothetical protein Hamer_G026462, partial [Homarus americanus]
CSRPWSWLELSSSAKYHQLDGRTELYQQAAIEDDGISCDETERVGLEIQHSMDNQPVSDDAIKRRQIVCTLNYLKPEIKVDKQEQSKWISTNLIPKAEAQQLVQGILVIDGGWLLHNIRWGKNATYSSFETVQFLSWNKI